MGGVYVRCSVLGIVFYGRCGIIIGVSGPVAQLVRARAS